MRAWVAGTLLAGLIGHLCAAAPAFAQSTVPAPAAPTSQRDAPIVVTGPAAPAPGEKLSAWKRAAADDVVVYSNGDEKQLVRVTQNLERLHGLLARLYHARGGAETPARVTIVLFDAISEMHALGLTRIGSDEGPFARPFAMQRYYDPRPDGSIIALVRTAQLVEMNTNKARNADCDDLAESGMECLDQKPIYHPPVIRSWESILYGAYAQHVILHYAPAAYPRWYFDGIGALFSTVVFKRDGSIEYGRPPDGFRAVLRSYGLVDTRNVLNGQYLRAPATRMDWTPFHAWLLTHYFVLSDLKAAERQQFARYMAALSRGKTMADAAQAFGSMTELRRDVLGYAERPHDFAKTIKADAPLVSAVTTLTQPSADALMASLAPRY
jgi:hypothetical protein